jgi:regulator of protease activity HflC (stomatin/prohibitin superfamily)
MTDRDLRLISGWPALAGVFLGLGLIIVLFVAAAQPGMVWLGVIAGLGIIVWFISLFGFVVNGPNHTRVVQLFGKYVGTLSETGFFYGNPFYLTTKVSLRVRTFETGTQKPTEVRDATGKVVDVKHAPRQPLKVNDKDGTPIEISAVVVWKVTAPAQAVFQVDDYESYVQVLSDAALRNLASQYSYDAPEDDRHSLRGHIEEVAAGLKKELEDRFHQAGVDVIESRISYLAYAPEIASAMLQRQQAGAVIAARRQIVDAAVGMVEHALEELEKREVVQVDPERKAAMVSNLLVVLCGHQHTQPVVNAGTLHN